MNDLAVEITDLTKIYDNKFKALSGINLSIEPGDFFALLGTNGAGKTTTINILTGLISKTSGVVKSFGYNQDNNINEIKKLIGLMPQEFNFNIFEPVREILVNQAGYYGIKRSAALVKAEELLKKVELWDRRYDKANSLSGGMKRRLMMARALMHSPKILILDEPSAGVDVEIRLAIWNFLKDLNKEGITIILTTHYLEEAERLCKNVAIINKGEVAIKDNMKKLLKRATTTITVTTNNEISKLKLSYEHEIIGNTIKVILKNDSNITNVLKELCSNNIDIDHINTTKNSLEELFIKLTQQ